MKAAMHFALALSLLLACGGCAVHMPPPGGLIYSDCNLPAIWSTATPQSTTDFRGGPPYEILGRARGEARAISILGLLLTGDAGAGTAYERALATKSADALLSPRMDYKGYGVLGIFAQITVVVEGEAIKFKK